MKIKNNYYLIIILSIIVELGITSSPLQNNAQSIYNNAKHLEQQQKINKALQLYLQAFNIEPSNKIYIKKIKSILIEKGNLDTLTHLYEKHISHIKNPDNKFLAELDLLDLKMWNNDNWEIFSKFMLDNYNQTSTLSVEKSKYIIHRLIASSKNEHAVFLINNIRTDYNQPSFFSQQLCNIFDRLGQNREAINECLIFLEYNKSKRFPYSVMYKKIFSILDRHLNNIIIIDDKLPITSKQSVGNAFLSAPYLSISNQDDMNFIIYTYQKLIEKFKSEEAMIELANINYRILIDLDESYKLYENVINNSTNLKLGIEATLGKANILISKGDINASLSVIEKKLEDLDRIYNLPDDFENNLRYKKAQIIFLSGQYEEMKMQLDSLMQFYNFDHIAYNELLETKSISLFFNENPDLFIEFAKAQHKIAMNKNFEAILELSKLIKVDNILISEISQYQYALLELKKGNIKNVKMIASTMNGETIFSELSMILIAEIEDFINNDLLLANKLYNDILNKYPNTIYKEHIIKRLNEINKILEDKIDL